MVRGLERAATDAAPRLGPGASLAPATAGPVTV
jgi:hypothetical protein